jgi:hypothetical protein
VKPGSLLVALLLLPSGCGHSDAFTSDQATVGPFSTGSDVQLTLNVEQDYWPTWTQDGQGILYAFVAPGATVRHRCLGLLPAAGGTRIWELCDNRGTQGDSVNSIAAYALASDGRLLYAVGASDSGLLGRTPQKFTLWLADTAAPFQRTALLTLPAAPGGSPNWLADITWTGANTFVALAQTIFIAPVPLPPCNFVADSIFGGESVVTGTIAAGHATLQTVSGTEGASGYSLAENGASIVFTLRNDQQLFKVPVTGGTAVAVSPVLGGAASKLLGVSCKGSTCVVANDIVTFYDAICSSAISGVKTLFSVSLSTGAVQTLTTSASILATPQISPVSGDVVVQVGGAFGHIQTIKSPSNGNLHLLRSLVP